MTQANTIRISMHSQQYDTLKIHMKQVPMRWDTIHPCYDAVWSDFDAMEKIWLLLIRAGRYISCDMHAHLVSKEILN